MTSERFDDFAAGINCILKRIEDNDTGTFCESIEDLERRHDALVREVSNLAALVREALNELSEQSA